MLANSCAAAATGIHTQSNALVTSKIRARKTPKLIRSRVLSIAIAGKPVPPEVRKKIARLCFTLIFFYLSLTAVLRKRWCVLSFRGFHARGGSSSSSLSSSSSSLTVTAAKLTNALILSRSNSSHYPFQNTNTIRIKIGSTFAVFVRNRTRPSRVRRGKVANARQNSNVRRRGLFSDRHWGCFG